MNVNLTKYVWDKLRGFRIKSYTLSLTLTNVFY